MSDSTLNPWPAILEDARNYPSPHNSQPIKVRPHAAVDGGSGAVLRATVSYDLDLGLPAESFGIPFGHVCAGVFLESLAVVAAAHGYDVRETLDHAEMDFDSPRRQHRIAEVELVPRDPDAPGEAERDAEARAALERFRTRHTSRRPYDRRAVPAEVRAAAARICADAGAEFRSTDDAALVRRIVHVNQATLFDDLENDAVYGEIMHWLRFSKREAAEKADGLSAEAMLMPGSILRYVMAHRRLWRAPVVGAVIRSIYLRTMRGVHQLGWIEGPSAGPRTTSRPGGRSCGSGSSCTATGSCCTPSAPSSPTPVRTRCSPGRSGPTNRGIAWPGCCSDSATARLRRSRTAVPPPR
ncbi:hypothetical protein AB3K78_10395 [Leucobacter sp. HNU]|uniref:hypothetical protein n=1 Tax=Leucobacter sp. HNU TaxID=3236805 RepID=UPI003A80D25E